jgi:hypothetical protein
MRFTLPYLTSQPQQSCGFGLRQGRKILLGVLCLLLVSLGPARAGELGHYAPGVLNIRDFLVPDPGFYFLQYFVWYNADTFRNRNGDKVKSINVGNTTLKVDTKVDAFVLAPAFVWVSPWKFLGARYGAQIVPTFGNTSVQAALRTETGFGVGVDESQFGVGDLFVKPVWLGWDSPHYSVTAGYGFYAPVGKYNNGDADNIGLGFWTHEFQLATAWYPWEHRGTAVTLAGTYEIHSEYEDVNITPGDRFSLNWGISQYLPLNEANSLLLEVGAMGYSQWQVEKDSGSDVNTSFNPKDQVHAAGGQIGLTYVPWKAFIAFHGLQEFGAEARFEGQFFTWTVGKKFF